MISKIPTLEEKQLNRDGVGRVHLQIPNSGSSYLYLSAQRFNPTTVVTHTTNVYNIYKDSGITSLMAIADGGLDFGPNLELNALFSYRLFQKLKLDIFSVFLNAAQYSSFNPVEHLWPPLSNHLSEVDFSPCIKGESIAPSQQSSLSDNAVKEKEKTIFDKALEGLNQHWENVKFDGFLMEIEKVTKYFIINILFSIL